ncbi:MAG: PRC-barrel domain [Gaiellaceae bacterium]|jgi:sporulation protein YlmC with PRC-barrel domain|nr:PRC-barrel domain [Gaiellaceae bacterium]
MRLSELLHREVVTESGRKLGHVHDVRAERKSDRLRVTAVLVGRRALLEHFGLGIGHGTQGAKMRTAADVVPWEAVVRVADGKVVVRDGTETSSGRRRG